MAGKNTLKPNSVYLFVNRRTNLVLQAPVERGAAVTQEKPEGNKLQLWTPIPCEDGSFRFMNPATAFMLDTVYSGTAAGTWANAWDENSESQLWRVEVAARGYRKFTQVHSGKVLDIAFMSMNPGVPAQIWEDVGGENQQWKILEYPSPEAAACIAGAGLKAAAKKAAAHSGKVLDNAEDVLSDVAGLAAEAANNMKPVVKKAKRAAKKTVRSVAAKADEAAKEIKKNVKKTAQAVSPEAVEARERAADAAEEFIDSLKED